MRIRQVWRAAAVAAGITALAAGTALASASAATSSPGDAGHGHHGDRVRHVLLISVDGLHQQDLAWYIKNYPGSLLAALARHGLEYSNAGTPFPSDSFPGMVAQVTGGDPRVTGIYYDDTFNHDVFPAGTTNCTGPVPGAEVAYTEADDINLNALDAGQGLGGLPGSILQMTGNPLNVINPANLPVNPKTCKPIYPNQYLKVNTIFDVARQHGLRTAWSDKHPAYQALSGPSGNGVQDYFTPEINSQAIGYPAGEDWTSDHAVWLVQGAGDPERDRRLRSQPDASCRCSRHIRHELPDRVNRAKAAHLRRPDGRVPGWRQSSGAPASARPQLHQHADRGDGLRDRCTGPGQQHGDHHLRQARAVPDQPECPGPRPRWADHRRRQRSLDRRPPQRGESDRLLDR